MEELTKQAVQRYELPGFDLLHRDQWFPMRLKVEIFNHTMKLDREVCATKEKTLPLLKTSRFEEDWQTTKDSNGNFLDEDGQRYTVSPLRNHESSRDMKELPYEFITARFVAEGEIRKSKNLHNGRSATVAWRTMVDTVVNHFSKNPSESRAFQPVVDRFKSIIPESVSNDSNPYSVLQGLITGPLAPFFWRGFLETATSMEPSAAEASFKSAASWVSGKGLKGPPLQAPLGDMFNHAPLEAGARAIRLLVLYPAREQRADVVCCLCNTSLDRSPDYEALSYVWGDASRTRPIRLNGKRFAVTENLDLALRQLRDTTNRIRVLWIDALCINQDDIAERSHQVRQMDSIYSQARQVIVWLGPGSNITDRGFNFLTRIDSQLRDGMVLEAASKILKMPGLNAGVKDARTVENWFKEHQDDLQALTILYERPWFERVWTMQELLCAKNTICQCGGHMLPFEAFASFEQTFIDWKMALSEATLETLFGEANYERFLFAQSRASPLIYWKQTPQLLPFTILDFFLILAGRKATDHRDLLFALRGLLPDDSKERKILEPDYSLSVADVYTQFSRDYINLKRNLDILSWGSNQGVDISLLPSWVLDWRKGESGVCYSIALGRYVSKRNGLSHLPFQLQDDRYNPFIYNASLAREAPEDFRFSEDSQILFANAIVVDTIANVGDKHLFDIDTVEQWKAMVGAETSESYQLTQQSRKESFWRTILADEMPRKSSFDPRTRLPKGHFTILDDLQFPPRTIEQEATMATAVVNGYSRTVLQRRMFLSTKGYIGLGPQHATVGDIVMVLIGAMVPFVLRQYGHYHFLIGESYIHGIMDGEIMSLHRKGELAIQTILIG